MKKLEADSEPAQAKSKVKMGFAVAVKLLSHFWLFCNPMHCAPPGSSAYGISRQEHWSGLPFPSPGDLPDPGLEPESPALAGRLSTTEPGTASPEKPQRNRHSNLNLSSGNSCCSWGSHGKITGVVCHSLLQWATFCQTSPPWPVHLGWPHVEWLSFIVLDTTMVLWSGLLVFCES